ncbi:MAG TPA: phosphoribosylformylglycinamidine synthase subunit PurQ [Saprospiraceae bacterium]|nr:phosphoribosylformylglycinamidine synthase subunit PurQ [Saprospiraceae bacterium]HMQ83731.1 phosphoribosylformylglycinamidine synthase subunit PurQ [Saprospiraceae bacterium]
MKFGVVVFPGSNCDDDMVHVLRNVMQQDVVKLWHKDRDIDSFETGDCIVLPGGFSYGDYVRAGAIARFSPIVDAVIEFANSGGYVWGICNGFQILCEAGLLPGVLLRNSNHHFVCKNVFLRTETNNSPITSNIMPGKVLKIPIAHAEGRYYDNPAELQQLEDNGQVLFRYATADGAITEAANPNGAINNIAGICNEQRNVFGMMPHPERAAETILGNTDGRLLFESMLATTSSKMLV